MVQCWVFQALKELKELQTGSPASVMVAHQKWKQAVVEAKRSTGTNSYDAGVVSFLIGRHRTAKRPH